MDRLGLRVLSCLPLPVVRAQADPVGGSVARPLEVLSIDECLKPVNGMAVKSLPVAGNDPGTFCQ